MNFHYSEFDKQFTVENKEMPNKTSYHVADYGNGQFGVTDELGVSQKSLECILETVYAQFSAGYSEGFQIDLRCPIDWI